MGSSTRPWSIMLLKTGGLRGQRWLGRPCRGCRQTWQPRRRDRARGWPRQRSGLQCKLRPTGKSCLQFSITFIKRFTGGCFTLTFWPQEVLIPKEAGKGWLCLHRLAIRSGWQCYFGLGDSIPMGRQGFHLLLICCLTGILFLAFSRVHCLIVPMLTDDPFMHEWTLSYAAGVG